MANMLPLDRLNLQFIRGLGLLEDDRTVFGLLALIVVNRFSEIVVLHPLLEFFVDDQREDKITVSLLCLNGLAVDILRTPHYRPRTDNAVAALSVSKGDIRRPACSITSDWRMTAVGAKRTFAKKCLDQSKC